MKLDDSKYELRKKRVHNDENPLEMMVNLMDVMLVFACGLMLALIINWNVDITPQEVDYTNGQEVTDTELDNDKSDSDMDQERSYKKMGTVYQDPETGKMYMVSDEEQDTSGGASAADAGERNADGQAKEDK